MKNTLFVKFDEVKREKEDANSFEKIFLIC
jgi:hypothetical protein